MDKESYSAAEAARILGVSIPTLKSIVADGDLESFKTTGGHLRILAESVEAFQHGNNNHTSRPTVQPSTVLMNRRERVQELGLEAQELRAQRDLSKLRKEAAEEAERDQQDMLRRDREERLLEERNHLEQEREEREQEEAERLRREAEQRSMWKDRWLSEALKSLPRDCPQEYYTDVCREVEEALDRLDPNRAEYVIRESVSSAVERGLRSWRRDKAIEKAIQDAENCLPVWAKSFCEPTEWQIKVRRMARQNITRLGMEASREEIRAATIEAGQAVARQYEEADEEKRHQQKKKADQQNQELTVQLALMHVCSYLRQLERDGEFEFEDSDWLIKKLEKRIRPELLKEIQAEPDLDYRDLEEIVEDLVDEFLPDFVEED